MSRKFTKPSNKLVAFFQVADGQQPRAALAAGLPPDALHAVAKQFGLSSVVLDDLAPEGLAKQFSIVGVRKDVAPPLPEVGGELVEMLAALAHAQGERDRAAQSAADGRNEKTAAEAAESENAAVATREATQEPGEQPAELAKFDAAVGDSAAREIWPNLATGHVVLVADYDEDGDFNGWWPAKLLSRTANEATLKWVGFDDFPDFVEPVTSLAVVHPAYRS